MESNIDLLKININIHFIKLNILQNIINNKTYIVNPIIFPILYEKYTIINNINYYKIEYIFIAETFNIILNNIPNKIEAIDIINRAIELLYKKDINFFNITDCLTVYNNILDKKKAYTIIKEFCMPKKLISDLSLKNIYSNDIINKTQSGVLIDILPLLTIINENDKYIDELERLKNKNIEFFKKNLMTSNCIKIYNNIPNKIEAINIINRALLFYRHIYINIPEINKNLEDKILFLEIDMFNITDIIEVYNNFSDKEEAYNIINTFIMPSV